MGHYCDDDDTCGICRATTARKTAVDAGRCPCFLVVAVTIARCYGGPEEGGWWYDRTDVVDVRRAFTMKGGLVAARALRAEWPQPRYSRGSVLGGADVYIRTFYGEDDPRFAALMEPQERPRYE